MEQSPRRTMERYQDTTNTHAPTHTIFNPFPCAFLAHMHAMWVMFPPPAAPPRAGSPGTAAPQSPPPSSPAAGNTQSHASGGRNVCALCVKEHKENVALCVCVCVCVCVRAREMAVRATHPLAAACSCCGGAAAPERELPAPTPNSMCASTFPPIQAPVRQARTSPNSAPRSCQPSPPSLPLLHFSSNHECNPPPDALPPSTYVYTRPPAVCPTAVACACPPTPPPPAPRAR